MAPTIGDKVTFYDSENKPHEARIVAVYPAERGRGIWHGDDGPDEEPGSSATLKPEEFELAPERVDLVYGPGGQPLHPSTQRSKFSVVHESKQTPNALGTLGNYWK
jgi:hypothetical protein